MPYVPKRPARCKSAYDFIDIHERRERCAGDHRGRNQGRRCKMDHKAAQPDRAIACWYCSRSVSLPREFWRDLGLDETANNTEDDVDGDNNSQDDQDDQDDDGHDNGNRADDDDRVAQEVGRTGAAAGLTSTSAQRNAEAGPSRKRSASPGETPAATAAGAAQGKKRIKLKKLPPERRLAPFIAICPRSTEYRMQRALSQRMFLIDREDIDSSEGLLVFFKVMGSTGNVYTVTITRVPECDCPDFAKGDGVCKHVIFVFLRVLKVSSQEHVWYQTALLESELKAVLAAAPTTTAGVSASVAVRNVYNKAIGKEGQADANVSTDGKRTDALGGECPICWETMTKEEDADADQHADAEEEDTGDLVWHTTGCGNPIHRECYTRWAASARERETTITCPTCRGDWKTLATGAEGTVAYSDNGYLNVADVAGVSRWRDDGEYGAAPRRYLWRYEYT